jgi:hypothetical protein
MADDIAGTRADGQGDVRHGDLPRGHGDIQTAVVNLVDRLAPVIPVSAQPALARAIAEVLAARPSTMRRDMFIRQSIIRRATATPAHIAGGLAAWVTVLFDLANLQGDRLRALDIEADLPDAALDRLTSALAASRQGCILAVPHIGSIELFASLLKDRGFNLGFVYTIGKHPTPTERWIYAGRSATRATPIAFGRRDTGAGIANILHNNGVVIMVADVYPSEKYKGINVKIDEAAFNFPPGPARFARTGTLVLPGFATRRDRNGFKMEILGPLVYRADLPVQDAASGLTQALAAQIGAFTAARPEAYWLWHPIPNDPYLAIAQSECPDLLQSTAMSADDEAAACAIEALGLVLPAQ